jgi:hypothetical protein
MLGRIGHDRNSHIASKRFRMGDGREDRTSRRRPGSPLRKQSFAYVKQAPVSPEWPTSVVGLGEQALADPFPEELPYGALGLFGGFAPR